MGIVVPMDLALVRDLKIEHSQSLLETIAYDGDQDYENQGGVPRTPIFVYSSSSPHPSSV